MIRREVNQYYTREKFNRQVEQLKRVNRIYGRRGGTKI